MDKIIKENKKTISEVHAEQAAGASFEKSIDKGGDEIAYAKLILAGARNNYRQMRKSKSEGIEKEEEINLKRSLESLYAEKKRTMTSLKNIRVAIKKVNTSLRDVRKSSGKGSRIEQMKIELLEAELAYRKACLG